MSDPHEPAADGWRSELENVGTSVDAVVSAFDQAGVIVTAFEGTDLRIAAWNGLARATIQRAYGGLGAATRGSPWLRGTGFEEKLVRVVQTGQPFSASEWPITLPTESGELREGVYDFH